MKARRPEDDLGRISRRLGVQTAMLLLLSLAIVGALVFWSVLRSQSAALDQTLRQAIGQVHLEDGRLDDEARSGDDATGANRVRLAVLVRGRIAVERGMPSGLPDRTLLAAVGRSGYPDQRTVEVGGRPYALRTERRGAVVVQAAYPLIEQQAERRRLLQAILLGGGAGLLLTTGLALWLSRRAVQPMARGLALQRRFVADASHELRTPLTLLSTRAQLLRRRLGRLPGPSTEPLLTEVDGLVADAGNLAEILEDLLLAADTRAAVPAEPVILSDVVAEASEAARPAAGARGVEVRVRSGEPLVLPAGSRPALLRAVTALVDNAVDHADSLVEVGVRAGKDSIEVEVQDDGPGLGQQATSTLFARLSSGRPRPEATSARRHYGLGLALVSEVAARHFGSVDAGDRLDGRPGARFVLRLPNRVPTAHRRARRRWWSANRA